MTTKKKEKIKSLYRTFRRELQSLSHDEIIKSKIKCILIFGFDDDEETENFLIGNEFSVLDSLKINIEKVNSFIHD